jgi:ADP-heptose:LPS heptosyltransferase
VIARLRKERFDVAFNLHGGSTGAILARLSGARHSVGYKGQPLSWLLSERAPGPDFILHRSRIHSVEQQLALLNWSGVPNLLLKPRLSLFVPPDVRARVIERLKAVGAGWNNTSGAGFACIVPGAAFESKQWTADGFAAVADHLSERWSLGSVIIAGPGQEMLARQVTSATHARTVVMEGLNLKELMSLLGSARVFVGNDSGPMHIAAAMGCPVIAVWGSSNPSVWHPWTETPYRVVEASAETRDSSIPEPETSRISRITASEVNSAVDEVLQLVSDADLSNHKGGIAN